MMKSLCFIASLICSLLFLPACGGGITEHLASIRIDNVENKYLEIGSEAVQLRAILNPPNIPESEKAIIWQSDKPQVLSCTESGLIRPVAVGSAVISAISKVDEDIRDSVEFFVIPKSGGFSYSIVNWEQKQVSISHYSGDDSVVTVPEEVFYQGEFCTVVRIDGYVFQEKNDIREVVLPDTITKIGGSAFKNCKSLRKINSPAMLTEIEQNAFYGCSKLVSFTLAENLNKIGTTAFGACSRLVEINNYSSLALTKGDYSNHGGIAYRAMSINTDRAKDGETNILVKNNLVYYCHEDESLELLMADSKLFKLENLDANCTKIAYSAFYGDSDLSEVDLSASSVIEIGEQAFSNCASLRSVVIGSSIERIETRAFSACSKLNNISLANGLKYIGEWAFQNCSKLEAIIIPDSVEEISEYILDGCVSLTSLSVPYIGKYADEQEGEKYPLGYFFTIFERGGMYPAEQFKPFYNTNAQEWRYSSGSDYKYYIPSTLKVVAVTKATSLCFQSFENCVSLESVELNSNMTTLGNRSFKNCTGIKNIVIPNSIVNFDVKTANNRMETVFEGCRFDSVEYSRTCDEYSFENGLLRIKVLPTGSGYPKWYSDGINSLILQVNFDAVAANAIPKYAFYGCCNITDIDIPETVTKINERAFSYCPLLENINLPSSLTELGEAAFAFCTSLREIDVPSAVTKIGKGAFGSCTSLTSLSLPFVGWTSSSESYANKYHFGYIFGGVDFRVTGLTTEVNQSSSSGSYNPNYYIPNSVKSVTIRGGDIGHGAFNNCTTLESVELSDAVSSIGTWAFSGCTNLRKVKLPSTLANLSAYAVFHNCWSFDNIVIPASCAAVSAEIFLDNSSTSAQHPNWPIFLESGEDGDYSGYQEGWDKHTYAENHPIYYYSENQPTAEQIASGKLYWHYVDDQDENPQIIIWDYPLSF